MIMCFWILPYITNVCFLFDRSCLVETIEFFSILFFYLSLCVGLTFLFLMYVMFWRLDEKQLGSEILKSENRRHRLQKAQFLQKKFKDSEVLTFWPILSPEKKFQVVSGNVHDFIEKFLYLFPLPSEWSSFYIISSLHMHTWNMRHWKNHSECFRVKLKWDCHLPFLDYICV